MGWNPLTLAELTTGKPWTQALSRKIKECLEYLYGGVAGGATRSGVPNGSFEIDSDADGTPDMWTVSLYPGGSFLLDTALPNHGGKIAKFTHPGGAGNGGGYIVSEYIEVSPTWVYFFGWTYWCSAAGPKVIAHVLFYDKDKVYISTADLVNSTTNPVVAARGYQTFSPPATARYVKFELIAGYTDTDVAATIYFDDIEMGPQIATQVIADAQLTQAKLKTSTGEVSTAAAANLTLPGGEYGFYPQIKAVTGNVTAQIGISYGPAGYVTNIYLSEAGGGTGYAQQRYVTSSGEVFWLFLLRDKVSGKILATFAAPDHPCFGNGGDPTLVAHPFPDYKKAAHVLQVINPDPETVYLIRSYAKAYHAAFLDAALELCDIDDSVEAPWPDVPITVALPDQWEERPVGSPIVPIKMKIPRHPDIMSVALKTKKKLKET